MVIYACLFFLGKIDENILLYVRYIGAVYLIYLAALCFYYAKTEVIAMHGKTDAVPTLSSTVSYLSQGLRSSVLNPKNILFYSLPSTDKGAKVSCPSQVRLPPPGPTAWNS